MTKLINLFATLFLICLFGCSGSGARVKTNDRNKIQGIIFDSDIGPDYDDAGAITVLHALAARGECKILATMASNRAPYTAPALEAFNRYFGHPEIPVGAPGFKGQSMSPGNHWTDSIASKYLPALKTNEDYPDAVTLYRKTLASQPDNSVLIVTVGFLTNLEGLLKSGPDSISSLSGLELVRKKVKKYVAMAGVFPEGREFNVYIDSTASKYVFQNWPTPILFSGFEIGEKLMTGHRLSISNVKGPAHDAYQYCLKTYAGKEVQNRNSWDQTAVLCAVRNPEKYFYLSGTGTFICKTNGSDVWDPDKDSGHRFLIHKYPYHIIADQIEDLMMYQLVETGKK
jgi:inosine-uridine nucleoside N-ribohydrolase